MCRASTVESREQVALPGVVGVGQTLDVLVGQLAMDSVDQRAQLAGVDEQRFAATVADRLCQSVLVPRQKPQADRNLRAVKQLARHRHHAIDQIGLDDLAADVAFARLVTAHAAVGQHEPGGARRSRGGG